MSSAKVTVVGMIRRGEMKFLPSGSSIYEFSVPIDKKWNDKQSGEQREKTSWINLKAFAKTGENIEKYIGVGKGGIFFGELETEEWESDGGKRSKTVINVQSFDFAPVSLADSGGQAAPQPPRQQAAPASDGFDDFDDDIPF